MGTRSFGFLRKESARARSRGLQGDFRQASQRITAELDSDRIIQAAVEEIHRSLGFPHTSIWLTHTGEEPRLACSAGPSDEQGQVPPQVLECARTVRPVQNETAGILAFPIVT